MAIAEPNNIQEETQVMVVTPTAIKTIRDLLEQRQIPNHSLRVFVAGGGCSGMQYGMSFEEAPQADDLVLNVDGVSLVVDPTSLIYLQGAIIDFVDSLMGGGFRIDNPNAVSSCGCGQSFKSEDSAAASDGGCGCGSGGSCGTSY